jgi:hypothetical protein
MIPVKIVKSRQDGDVFILGEDLSSGKNKAQLQGKLQKGGKS